jgi:hypothetical protein
MVISLHGKDLQAQQAFLHYIMMLRQQHFDLLPTSIIQSYYHFLPNNITLLGVHDLDKIGPIDLVISKWPC